MKVSNIFLAFALLLSISLTNAASDVERQTMTKEERIAAKKAARAERMNKKNHKKPKPELLPEPEPEKGMYFELVYIEKECENFQVELSEGLDGNITIGDKASFKCELYEKAIRFGTYGGDRVGDTYWNCEVAAFQDIIVFLTEFSDVFIFDCTITDYIGGDVGTTYIRNEGVTLGIGPFDEEFQQGFYWDVFHSHTGSFAVAGGINEAKGIRGQLDVVWDDYKMSWFHIYHVEAWNLGPNGLDYWWG